MPLTDAMLTRLYDAYTAAGAVTTDSRRIMPGAIFFALRGENFDGNDYAAQALTTGAALCVVDREEAVVDDRCVLVDDSLEVLQALARHHRQTLGIPILAITGSNGKTTTKELAARVLACKYRLSVTRGNLNNHIGVPLTLLAMTRQTEFGIVEMGASRQGEIALLCSIAEPDYGLITNVGKSHLEGFGGAEGVRKGKGEMLDYLAAHGRPAFYPEESDALREMAAERIGLKTMPYSTDGLQPLAPGEGGTLRLAIKQGDLGLCCKSETLDSHLVGDYNLFNVAAALALAACFGVAAPLALRAIESYVPDNARSQRRATARNILYIDSYNANPSSMQASILNFSRIGRAGYESVLILGDMLELGKYSDAEHDAILALAQELPFDRVYLVGGEFRSALLRVAPPPSGYEAFGTVDDLCAFLQAVPIGRAQVLIKGSRGIHLERIEPYL
jgi:UDP-N-acetylmuramoyl-tripeptide--D-alanyl-D-alanine ligase